MTVCFLMTDDLSHTSFSVSPVERAACSFAVERAACSTSSVSEKLVSLSHQSGKYSTPTSVSQAQKSLGSLPQICGCRCPLEVVDSDQQPCAMPEEPGHIHTVRACEDILRNHASGTGTGFNFQIFSAYSPTVRSLENLPMLATFRMDRFVHSCCLLYISSTSL